MQQEVKTQRDLAELLRDNLPESLRNRITREPILSTDGTIGVNFYDDKDRALATVHFEFQFPQVILWHQGESFREREIGKEGNLYDRAIALIFDESIRHAMAELGYGVEKLLGNKFYEVYYGVKREN